MNNDSNRVQCYTSWLLFRNLVPTLPTMHLSHWATSLKVVSSGGCYFLHMCSSAPPKTCKYTLMGKMGEVFFFKWSEFLAMRVFLLFFVSHVKLKWTSLSLRRHPSIVWIKNRDVNLFLNIPVCLYSSSALRWEGEGEPCTSQTDRQYWSTLSCHWGYQRWDCCFKNANIFHEELNRAIKLVLGQVFKFLLCSFLKTIVSLEDAYENARGLCDRYYMNSPELVLEEFNGKLNKHFRFFILYFTHSLPLISSTCSMQQLFYE